MRAHVTRQLRRVLFVSTGACEAAGSGGAQPPVALCARAEAPRLDSLGGAPAKLGSRAGGQDALSSPPSARSARPAQQGCRRLSSPSRSGPALRIAPQPHNNTVVVSHSAVGLAAWQGDKLSLSAATRYEVDGTDTEEAVYYVRWRVLCCGPQVGAGLKLRTRLKSWRDLSISASGTPAWTPSCQSDRSIVPTTR